MEVRAKERISQESHVKRYKGKKARENDSSLPLLNVFIIIAYDGYRKMIPYTVPSNENSKMTTEVYTTQILPQIAPELCARGLTLCQDADSAHKSQGTANWAKKYNVSLLTLPGVSPDLSILETIANPCKRKFHSKRTVSHEAGVARFKEVLFD